MPIGRTYAGTLGTLAFALMALRGLTGGAGMEQTVLMAAAGMFVCAAIGYLVGKTAEHLVNESVRTQFQVAMATWDEQRANSPSSLNPTKTKP